MEPAHASDIPSRPRFGLAVPQVFPDGIDLEEIRHNVTLADQLDFDSLWVMESGPRPGSAARVIEPLALLSHVAAWTTRVDLGTSVLLPVYRHPIQLATDLASLDQLSKGRLIVGVSRGHPQRGPLFGIPPENWSERFEEGLEVLRAVWAPGQASFAGRFFAFEDLAMEPKPLQQPHPPIWFGARAPAALERAIRLGTGWMGAGSSSTEDFVRQSGFLRQRLAERGEDGFSITKRIYVAIEEHGSLEDRVLAFFDHVYGNAELGRRCAVRGSPQRCAEEITEVVEAGAEMVVINPMFEHRRQLELFLGKVLPQLS